MENDRRYLITGIFVLLLAAGAAWALVWLAAGGSRDDLVYRIRFNESVSGLVPGEAVKYHGVDVGRVKSLALDAEDPRIVEVDVALRRDAPVKADTRATLKLKGITGGVYVELHGGTPKAQALVAVTPQGQVPVILAEKSSLATVMDRLPQVVEKFSAIEDQARRVLKDVGEFTAKVKENPSLLLRRPRKQD